MSIIEKYLWVEKHAPNKIEDMVLSEEYRLIFESMINEKEIPHLLLYGPPGSGKTTMAKILVKKVLKDEMDLMFFNGSAKTGVDVMRNNVEDFLKTPTFGSKIKIVFIDEADWLSSNAQAALRGISETYQDHGRFLLTVNYISKLTDAVQSRFGQSFEFKRLPKEFFKNHCEKILNKENIQFGNADLDRLITTFYPDMRRIIHIMQSRCIDGKLIVDAKDLESKEKLFRSFMTDTLIGISEGNGVKISSSVQSMQKLLGESEVDYVTLYQELFNDKVENVPIWAKVVINKYANTHVSAMIPSMHLMAMIYDIVRMGKQLRDLRK